MFAFILYVSFFNFYYIYTQTHTDTKEVAAEEGVGNKVSDCGMMGCR